MSEVWAVTMVGDEADVAGECLRHLISEGVNGIIVADNLSTDGTRAIIERVSAQASIPIVITDDQEVGYFQDRKMTGLAKLAAERGAGWIIPFDIDELWCGQEKRFAEALQTVDDVVKVIGVPTYTYIESGYDDGSQEQPFLRIRHRRQNCSQMPKVCFRYDPAIKIDMGNHSVTRKGTAVEPVWMQKEFSIRHFPYRSPEQFIQKMRRGSAAYARTKYPENIGSHWRTYGRILEKYGEEAMRMIYFSQFFVAEPWRAGLMEDPAPLCRWR